MTRPANRLRIAMQKSGRLADPARNLLKQAGFQFRSDKDQLLILCWFAMTTFRS